MENELPRAYLDDVSAFIYELADSWPSKDEYNKLDVFLSELSEVHALRFLELIRDGIVVKMQDHKKTCLNPDHCDQLKMGEKAINSLERRINERKRLIPVVHHSESETPNHPLDHTTARQVIAIRFLLQYAKIDVKNDKAAERFIHFLTGKSKDNIYKAWRVASNKELDTNRIEDLQFIRKFFEELRAGEIVKMVNNEIDTK
jgi:hypothetical protein